MSWLEHRVPPPVVALLMAAVAWGLAQWPPAWPPDNAIRWPMALFLAFAGIAFDLSGLVVFLRRRTTINPLRPERASALVTGGVYRITRNPMYVGLCLLLLAWAVYLWSPWALAGPLLFVLWITRWQIVPEERLLEQLFGATYRAYRARVRRWL